MFLFEHAHYNLYSSRDLKMFSPAFVIKHMRIIDNSCFTFIHINLKTNELKKDIIIIEIMKYTIASIEIFKSL
jgi:hypothetical protein